MVDVVMVGNVPGCDRFSRQARQSYPGRLVSLPGLEVAFRLGSGDGRGLHMLLRWFDYDPIALVVLMFGIGAISLLALSM